MRRNDDPLDRVNDGNARQLADAVGREVGFAQYRNHSRNSARRRQIHANDTRECMGRANDMGMQHAGHMIVGDIFPAAGEEANILQAAQGLTLITLSQPLTVFANQQIRPGYWRRRDKLCKPGSRQRARPGLHTQGPAAPLPAKTPSTI